MARLQESLNEEGVEVTGHENNTLLNHIEEFKMVKIICSRMDKWGTQREYISALITETMKDAEGYLADQ